MSEQTESEAQSAPPSGDNGSLIDQIMQQTKMPQGDKWYEAAKGGMQRLLRDLVETSQPGERIHASKIDALVAQIDETMSLQVDQILHSPEVQKVESAWRSLKFLVDETEFRQNNIVEILNVDKDTLAEDFEDAPEIVKTGLYKHVYVTEYGQLGGHPVGAIIGNYNFTHNVKDVRLLRNIAAVSAMSHAPFIGNVAPQMFGIDDWARLPALKDISSIFQAPSYAEWNTFRESEDSRYIGLCLPRIMLRSPYDPKHNPIRTFNYKESAAEDSSKYVWGGANFALSARMGDSFSKYRWAPNIIGPLGGGTVENISVHYYDSMGEIEMKAPVDVMISDRREYELAEHGFIPLVWRKASSNAVFFSANSIQKAKTFSDTEEGREAQANYRLSTQLPSMFIINRLAHYIKVLQRENIGSWKNRNELEDELNNWIRQYVSDQDNPSAEVRSRRPLRKAQIIVSDVEGEAGWFRASLAVQPHMKYMGADFTLSLHSRLEKS